MRLSFLSETKFYVVESVMVQSRNKELDVALELFNSELEKLKLKEKELAIVKRAEKIFLLRKRNRQRLLG